MKKLKIDIEFAEHRACSVCLYVPCCCDSSVEFNYPEEAKWCATKGCKSDALNVGWCPDCSGLSDDDSTVVCRGGTVCVLKENLGAKLRENDLVYT